jgi:hypothetical protein
VHPHYPNTHAPPLLVAGAHAIHSGYTVAPPPTFQAEDEDGMPQIEIAPQTEIGASGSVDDTDGARDAVYRPIYGNGSGMGDESTAEARARSATVDAIYARTHAHAAQITPPIRGRATSRVASLALDSRGSSVRSTTSSTSHARGDGDGDGESRFFF